MLILFVEKSNKIDYCFGTTLDIFNDFAIACDQRRESLHTYIGFDVFQKISGSSNDCLMLLGNANASIVLWCTGTDAMIAHHIKKNSHIFTCILTHFLPHQYVIISVK